MTANIDPIFPIAWNLGGAGAVIGPNANTATDGTGANTTAIFTAGSTNGSFIDQVILKAVGSPAATVIRLWWLNDTGAFVAGTTNTIAKTFMLDELATAAFTASNLLASPQYIFSVKKGIPASTKLLMTFGTSTGAAGNGFNPLVIAGDY